MINTLINCTTIVFPFHSLFPLIPFNLSPLLPLIPIQLFRLSAELGEHQAKESDAADQLRETAEAQLAQLVSLYGALVVRACQPVRVRALRACAVLALCKLMLVEVSRLDVLHAIQCARWCCQESFCEQHLSLLFTIVEREPNEQVRANVIVCLGDLIARHPNTVVRSHRRCLDCANPRGLGSVDQAHFRLFDGQQ